MKFAIYARQSRFSGTGESIENQINACKRYIDYHFGDISSDDIKVFSDENFSGKNTKRPDFQKLLSCIDKKQFDYVLCYQLDRVSRNVNDFSSFLHELDEKRIKFVSIKEQFDTSTPAGKMMIIVIAACAQMERETIAERVKDNMMFLAKSGRWLGGTAPFGFTTEKDTSVILDGKVRKSTYLKCNEDIETVKFIFEDFLKYGSILSISKRLLDMGVKNATFGFVSRILSNPVYCIADKDSLNYFLAECPNTYIDKKDLGKGLGIIPFNRAQGGSKNKPINEWIIATGRHKGIVNGKDWVHIQRIMNQNKNQTKNRMSTALFASLPVCPLCGSKMRTRSSWNDDVNNFFYVCSKKWMQGYKVCPSNNLKGKDFDSSIIEFLLNYDIIKLKKRLNIRKYSLRSNKVEDKLEDLKFALVDLEKKKSDYISKILQVKFSPTLVKEIEKRVENLNDEIRKIKSQKEDISTQLEISKTEKMNVLQIVDNLTFFQKNFHTLDLVTKKSLIRLIINKIVWNGKKWEVIFNGE